MTNIGATTRQGASRNAQRTASRGITSSLTRSFTTSAIGCSRPHGPTRLGPMRNWMKPSTLRSMRIIAVTSGSTRMNITTRILTSGDST